MDCIPINSHTLITPERWTSCYSIKQTGFSVPLVPGLFNFLDNADTHLPLTQVCPLQLIYSTTAHYNSTGAHSTSLWLPFLASVQQERALERTSTARVCIAMPTGNILEASKIRMPLYSGHAWSHGVCIRFHCTKFFQGSKMAGSRQELNQGHHYLESPVLCH